jgi:hypothetical protein
MVENEENKIRLQEALYEGGLLKAHLEAEENKTITIKVENDALHQDVRDLSSQVATLLAEIHNKNNGERRYKMIHFLFYIFLKPSIYLLQCTKQYESFRCY